MSQVLLFFLLREKGKISAHFSAYESREIRQFNQTIRRDEGKNIK
jgi:hypothetical protein